MGVSLLLGGVLAVLALPGSGGAAQVVSVEVRLPPGSDPALIRDAPELVLVRRGKPLSLRDVQKSIERLIGTGRFADVEVRGEDVLGGLRVVFLLEPKRTLYEIYFEHHHVLSDEQLRAASKLSKGSEYYPEEVEQATEGILRAYRRKGYRSASVSATVTEGDQGVSLGLRIDEGLPTRLKQVVLSGDAGLPPREVLEVLELQLDTVLDLDQVDAALARLKERLRKEHFYRARVDPAEADEQGRLLIPVQAGPRLQIAFRGDRFFGPHALASVLGYDGSEVLDPSLCDRLAARLITFYQYRGFRDVRVRWVEEGGPLQSALVFVVDEGQQWVVQQVAFEGNHQVSSAELNTVLIDAIRASTPDPGSDFHPLEDPLHLEGRARPGPYAQMPEPDPQQVAVDQAYQEAARAMVNLYRERGFTVATVALKEIDLEPGGAAAVTFQVHEGPKALVKRVRFVGGPPGFGGGSQPYRVGVAYSARMLERWRQSLLDELQHQGYLYASVDAQVGLSPPTEADLTFTADPGPKVTVGKVLVRGNQKTSEAMVRGAVTLREGDVLDLDALFTSQRNLLALGAFSGIDVRLLSPETKEAVKDVEVVLEERPTLEGEWGLGYHLAEGFLVGVDGDLPNLGGRALNLSGRATLNYFDASVPALSHQVDVSDLSVPERFGGRGNLSLSNRGLLPANIGARLDLVGERVFRQSYRFTRFAAVPGLDWSTSIDKLRLGWTTPKLTLQLQYELEWARVLSVGTFEGQVLPLVRADTERLRFLFGTFALQTVRFIPTFDARDNALTPHKGFLVQLSAESTFDVYTRDQNLNYVPVKFFKLSGTVTAYVSLSRTVVLALSARAGNIFPLASGSVTPPVKRFFLGGASSMRGFPEDGLIAADQRQEYAREVNDCRSLASAYGCTTSANQLLSGAQLPSQGGELFYLGKAEVRFPAFGSFDWGVFVEAGNLWLGAPTSFSFRPVAGLGVRYATPIGPLALDLGFNLFPDPVMNEAYVQPHFNIGLF